MTTATPDQATIVTDTIEAVAELSKLPASSESTTDDSVNTEFLAYQGTLHNYSELEPENLEFLASTEVARLVAEQRPRDEAGKRRHNRTISRLQAYLMQPGRFRKEMVERYSLPGTIPAEPNEPPIQATVADNEPETDSVAKHLETIMADTRREVDDQRRQFAITMVDDEATYSVSDHASFLIKHGLDAAAALEDAKRYRWSKEAITLTEEAAKSRASADAMAPRISELTDDVNSSTERVETLRKRVDNQVVGEAAIEQMRVLREAEHACALATDELTLLTEEKSRHDRRANEYERQAKVRCDHRDSDSSLPEPKNFLLSEPVAIAGE